MTPPALAPSSSATRLYDAAARCGMSSGPPGWALRLPKMGLLFDFRIKAVGSIYTGCRTKKRSALAGAPVAGLT